MHIKKDDIVEVITGDDKDARAKVLRIDHSAGKLVVEGVNRVYKHVRRSQRNPQGGRLSKEMPVQISNVLLVRKTHFQHPLPFLRNVIQQILPLTYRVHIVPVKDS